MSEISLADNYKSRPVRGYGPIDVPFRPDCDHTITTCVNSASSVGLVGNQFDDEYRVVYAMIKPYDDVGVYTAYTSEQARELAHALNEMADYVDKENQLLEQAEQSSVAALKDTFGDKTQFIDLGDYMPDDPNAQSQVIWRLSPWALNRGLNYDNLGFIPTFLHTDDERSAKEQIDANYQHGGGWHEANEDGHWKLFSYSPVKLQLQDDPDDEPYNLIATCQVGSDTVHLFEYAWCAIVHVGGTMSVARLD